MHFTQNRVVRVRCFRDRANSVRDKHPLNFHPAFVDNDGFERRE